MRRATDKRSVDEH